MGTFSEIGIGLSVVFGFLLLALVGELYYLLWWKKKISRSEIGTDQIMTENEYGNYVTELTQLFRWRKSSSSNSVGNGIRIRDNVKGEEANREMESDPELGGSNKDLLLKALGGEEGVEAELMRLHNLAGPPRFLFPIKEESKEDLESDDGRSRKGSRTGSMMSSDLVLNLSPLASPRTKSPLNPLRFQHNGFNFNPLFESSSSSTEAELNRLRSSSPPPKFKFLRDAEEKLLRRLLIEETEKRMQRNSGFAPEVNQDGSFLKFIVGKNNEQIQCLPQCTTSSSSQVLPLSSSPITF